MSRIVVAVGGNALLPRAALPHGWGAGAEAPDELEAEAGVGVTVGRLSEAADRIAELAREHELVVTHGNGPQIGLLALRAAASPAEASEPLDVLGAESEGMIGYLLERELRSRMPERSVATLLTQVEVDAWDPAFSRPTKPIGPGYSEADAERLRRDRGWTMIGTARGFRRAVASPAPQRILELEAVRILLAAGQLVVCGGGGGVPVVIFPDGRLSGVEAVVDKDLAAALLAEGVGAEGLLLLTDVEGIYEDWPDSRDLIGRATPEEIRRLDLPEGSMGPKAEAAALFVEATGGWASVGSIDRAASVAAGESGTRVAPG